MTTARPPRDPRLPLYQRLRDELAAEIAARRWQPGEAIPSESELVRAFSVATGTVRKAIDALVADGLVERAHGRGTYVRRARFDASLFRFFRFQSASGERPVPDSRILRRDVVSAPPAVRDVLAMGNGEKAIRLARLRLIDERPLLAEEIWLSARRFAALLRVETADFPPLLYPMYEEACGQVVASASESLMVESARANHARLLEQPRGTPLIVIERVARAPDGRPIEWRRSRGPAERFRYEVEIR